jgi:hypothetical protein
MAAKGGELVMPPNCGPPFCYDQMIWLPSGPYNYNQACQNAAREGGSPGWQYEYACDVQPDNGGYDVYCCMYGG